jgi:hypothetical protein
MKEVVRALAHGLSRAAISAVQGGKSMGGFLSGFAGSLLGGFVKGLDYAKTTAGTIMKVTMTAIAGGTASVLGGGKFANGAMSAAFVFMFNHMVIENTEAANGLHRRLVVYDGDGKRLYGISFGVIPGESIWGGKGSVYVDYMDAPTKIVGILYTTSAEDLRIISYMQSQVGITDSYNVLTNNCRDYSSKQFDYIGERILGR